MSQRVAACGTSEAYGSDNGKYCEHQEGYRGSGQGDQDVERLAEVGSRDPEHVVQTAILLRAYPCAWRDQCGNDRVHRDPSPESRNQLRPGTAVMPPEIKPAALLCRQHEHADRVRQQ